MHLLEVDVRELHSVQTAEVVVGLAQSRSRIWLSSLDEGILIQHMTAQVD